MPKGKAILGIAALLTTALFTTAADWPTYLGNGQRTGASAGETTLSTANAGRLTRLWSFQTGGVIAASATVVGGIVYVGSWDGNEYALDAATGTLKWKTFLGTTTAPNCSPSSAGVSSAAAVANGVVYVGGGDAFWYALDALTGAVLWRVFTGDNSATGGHYNWSSPLIYNGFAYIGIASLGDCPLVQGQLLQVDLSTHQVINTFNLVPNGQVGGGIWTSPAVDATTNTIYMTTGTIAGTQPLAQAIVAVDASSLALKSSWQLPAGQAINDSDWGNTPTLFSTAAGRPMVAAINKNGFLYALDRTNLAAGPVWQQQFSVGGICPTCGDGSVSSGAFAGGTLFQAGGNTTINGAGFPGVVRGLDPATGNFKWQHGSPGPVVPALAYANGLVLDGAGPWLEVLNATDGSRLFSYKTGGTLYGAPSVSNGEIFTGSVDGNLYAFGLPTTSPPPPPPDPNCPSGWTCHDVGTASPPGSDTVAGSAWGVTAGGAGVGGTADSFRFLEQTATGNTQVSAQVTSIQPTSAASEAGVMVRQSDVPGAPFYSVALMATNGLTVRYRSAFDGTTTAASLVTGSAAPTLLEIQRIGDLFQAATSLDGVTYTLVPGSTVSLPLPTAVLAGLAVSSDVNGSTSTAGFSSPAVGAPAAAPVATAPATACPTGWSCGDVGNPAPVGDQSLSAGTWSIKGAGNDVGGYSDQFHFSWQSLAADGTVSARVVSQTNTNGSAKAGLMLRQSTDAGSPYYGAFLTPANGIVVQYRTAQGLRTTKSGSAPGTAPAFLEVARSGNTFTAYTSTDGIKWTPVAGSSVSLSITSTILAGLAVTSANSGNLSTTSMDTVAISQTAPPPPNLCPSSWSCADIGNPTLAGSQSLSGNTWSVQGEGGDIWASIDQFRYVWQTLPSGGSVIAHVTAQTNTDGWAKAGVMLRQTADPGSPYYAAFVTPGNGITVQYRATQVGLTVKLANPAGAVPAYLQVADAGNTFTAYTSGDGVTWVAVPGSTVTASMGASLLAGLAVTSHNTGALGTATIDSVSVKATTPPPPPPPPCPTGWNCADIGNPTPAGTHSLSGGTWTIQGGGGDIWGSADQFHYAWQSLSGTGSVSARVTAQTNTSVWAKAGVMLRATADPGAPNYAVYMTPGNGLSVQYRATQGGLTVKPANPVGTIPAYVMVSVSGTTFTAYTSSDGSNWTPVPGSSVALSLPGPLLAGMAVTSHNTGALSTATMDTVSVSSFIPPPPPPPSCPTGWSCADVGSPSSSGTQSLSGSTWTVQAGGTDIFGTADQFHYAWQSLAASGSISAHVTAETNTSVWAKAGVMLRQTTDPGSPNYGVFVTPGNGITVQYRAAQGGATVKVANPTGTVPAYLKVTRSGSTFTALTSSDGVTWTPIVGSTVTLNITGSMLEGLAVTAHSASAICTVTMDSVVQGS